METPAPPTTPIKPFQTRQLILLGTLAGLGHLNRVAISVAGNEWLIPEVGFTEIQMGWVYTAFYLTYTLFMLPCGTSIDRWGPARALSAFGLLSGLSVLGMGLAGWGLALPATLLGIPLFHVLGLHAVFLGSFRGQRKLVTMYKWDASVAAELIERERIVTFTGPPAVSGDLVRVAQSEGRDLSSLLTVGGGGAARPPAQVGQIDDSFEKALPNTGWGMTETNAIGTLILGAEYSERRLSSGPALCVIDLRVVD
ncbi:MAG: hypothetical protein EBU26_18740, partial [Verrucomicrobia bacterium]|nr:hypothetical protein [Verrucomicrobiota bacterium]